MSIFADVTHTDRFGKLARWLFGIDQTDAGVTKVAIPNMTDDELIAVSVPQEQGTTAKTVEVEVTGADAGATVSNRWEQTSAMDGASADILLQLAIAAEERNARLFETLAAEIDWASRPAEEVVYVASLAINAGMFETAGRLARQGLSRHANHAELQKMTRILAPPKVTVTEGVRPVGWKENRAWLQAHQDRYRGKWVALRNGELLASAESMKALLKQVGEVRDKGILVTLVS